MIAFTCRIHGPLNVDQCYVHRRKARPETGAKARTDYDCKACTLAYRKNPKQTKKRRESRRLRYASDEICRQKKKDETRRRYEGKYGPVFRDIIAKARRALKLEVLAAYCGGSPRCRLCREANVRFLSLDHVEDDGKEHRKSVSDIYRWAKKNGFPDSLQVLCHNCNWLKHLGSRPVGASPSMQKLRDLKAEVMRHYCGGDPRCAECPVTDIRVLTMDHVGGGGNEHRRRLGGRDAGRLLRWLKKSGFPAGFRVLCFNHNMGKHCIGD